MINLIITKSFLFLALAIVTSKTLTITSSDFSDNGLIPSKYTCDGANINPELTIKDIPKETASLVLIVDDPHAPKGTFDHWVMWNIPVKDKIAENSTPGIEGKNGKGENKYTGPCPPSGAHHYHFKVYALDTKLQLAANSGKNIVLKAIEGHILASGELVGIYKK